MSPLHSCDVTIKYLWTLHRWLGLTFALTLIASLATGVTLMFQREFHLTGAAPLPHVQDSLAGLNAAIDAASSRFPELQPVSLSPPPDAGHAWQLTMNPRDGHAGAAEVLSVDPETGSLISWREVADAPASILLKLHVELFAGAAGHALLLLSGIGVSLLALSGLTILKNRRRVFLAGPLSGRDRWRGLHRWAGLVGAILVLMWGSSGALLMGRLVAHDWQPTHGSEPTGPAPLSASLATVLKHRVIYSQGEVYSISLPTWTAPAIEVTTLNRGAGPWHKYRQLRFDPMSGNLLTAKVTRHSMLDDVFAVADSLHKGQSDPLFIHRLYMLAVTFPALIVISGPLAWLRRTRAARRAPGRLP
jgi:uncharacterized iron-regulated membrane protein